MDENHYRIEGLTIAVKNMDSMVSFYSGVFRMEFDEKSMHGTSMYTSVWGKLRLLFCPAEIAGIDVNRNRQQFDIQVEDIEWMSQKALELGGKTMGEIQVSDELKTTGVYDPDGNSIVFKQYL